MRFRTADAFLPAPDEVLLPLTVSDTELEGTVVNFSDSGSKRCYFAVVDVVKKQAVVVPVDKLQIVDAIDSQ